MAWARIDDKFFDNPKVRTAGKDATYLYISALVYASNQMTEGYISDEVLGLVAYKGFIKNEIAHAKTLIDCELWDRVQGGYQIHDFLEYNPTRAEIEQARAKKQAAGSKGGQASAQARAQAFAQPSAQPSAQAEFNDTPSINPSPTHTHPIPIKDEPAAAAFSGKNAEIYKSYSSGIAELTPATQAAIDKAVDTYSANWVRDAIAEGVRYQANSFGYCEKVLARWIKSGRGNNGARKPDTGADLDKFKKLYQSQEA